MFKELDGKGVDEKEFILGTTKNQIISGYQMWGQIN